MENTENDFKEIFAIDPTYVTVFRAEMAVRKIDLANYTVTYSENESVFRFETVHISADNDTLGSEPGKLNYNVDIEKKTRRIMKVWISR
jgi:hypothetical protein